MAKRVFGELELQILHILKRAEKMTVKEVHGALGGKDNYNTIMTVMNRLVIKNQLTREKSGSHYEYWISGQTQSPSLFAKLKEKFFGVQTSALVNYLIESADDLSDQDLAEMEKMLEKAKAQRKR